ncbi:MAG: class I SAM-dependent methyltransferase [Deltaproteobacteria bacterium]|uniref:Class I SAM-dependent methyltransferase n=1 Tax=Candidatus Zymogenus saltonus TaxID=2844893 RepID=A0A9D8KCN1_9DELT|nr:class I SAM-dependent methyltransferase [Candidatus Zymogenus saltonus]
MANKLLDNARKPTKTIGGRLMLWGMNLGHNPMAIWALSHVDLGGSERLLDIGCGGGKNLANLLKLAPKAKVCGIDYSPASVEKSLSFNRAAVTAGKVEVKEASVEAIPYKDKTFDGVTAFESIYFWPNIADSFKEAARVLKKNGVFIVCNEAQGPEGLERIIKKLEINIYTGEEIKGFLEQAGFSNIEIDKHKKGRWLCVVGRK